MGAYEVSFEWDGLSDKEFAIMCMDYASPSGYEYTETASPQIGDGVLMAVVFGLHSDWTGVEHFRAVAWSDCRIRSSWVQCHESGGLRCLDCRRADWMDGCRI
mmetsp:Transcript_29655/g.76066  ORF Transcript_29655/g.76066 Transcript_29655/m.76066 type:complete len:103 (+) Transcript_29655:689-997(+)